MVIALRLPEIVEEVLEILLGPHQSAARISTVTTRVQSLSLPELLVAAGLAIRLIRAFRSLRADFANRSVGNLNKRINA